MTQAASRRGVKLTSKSRPLRPQDLSEFEYIVGMDPKNLKAMQVCCVWTLSGTTAKRACMGSRDAAHADRRAVLEEQRQRHPGRLF